MKSSASGVRQWAETVVDAADDGDHLVLEPGVLDGVPERRQRVEAAELGVGQRRVVVLPAGLVLLRAAVVVDGEHGAPAARAAAPR